MCAARSVAEQGVAAEFSQVQATWLVLEKGRMPYDPTEADLLSLRGGNFQAKWLVPQEGEIHSRSCPMQGKKNRSWVLKEAEDFFSSQSD